MLNLKSNESIINIFKRDRKCIINTDLDGILSGMLLQHFLNWDIVGFSSCCGKPDDELWLKEKDIDLKNCVFVDLPIWIKDYLVIDQHFIAFDKDSIKEYNEPKNKINPNIMRERIFKDEKGQNQYTSKYPFGTVHFILAILENLEILTSDFKFDFDKTLGTFDLADLFLRADRVIGNTYYYTLNCFDWIGWITNIGGKNTSYLFDKVKNEYQIRKQIEPSVEKALKNLGCHGNDGDCSNLFREKNYEKIKGYFNFLSKATGIEEVPVFDIIDYGKLKGLKYTKYNYNFNNLKEKLKQENIFSFAFIKKDTLSITYKKELDNLEVGKE